GLSLPVALCCAELASRFDATGGPYLFTRAAFGEFVGFEVGWMQWFSRASSQASIMAATAVALGYYFPALTGGWPRAAVPTALTPALAGVDRRARPPRRAGRRRADHRQAGAARRLLPRRPRVRADVASDGAAGDHRAAGARGGAAPDLHLRRLRGGADSRRRGDRPATRHAVRDGRDHRVGRDRHDAGPDRRARRAAEPRRARDADRRRGGGVSRRPRRACDRRRVSSVDDRQQRRAGVERLADALCAR